MPAEALDRRALSRPAEVPRLPIAVRRPNLHRPQWPRRYSRAETRQRLACGTTSRHEPFPQSIGCSCDRVHPARLPNPSACPRQPPIRAAVPAQRRHVSEPDPGVTSSRRRDAGSSPYHVRSHSELRELSRSRASRLPRSAGTLNDPPAGLSPHCSDRAGQLLDKLSPLLRPRTSLVLAIPAGATFAYRR